MFREYLHESEIICKTDLCRQLIIIIGLGESDSENVLQKSSDTTSLKKRKM